MSAPSSVVRSIIRIARSSAASFDALLDRALRELAGARLERDRVDGADPRQPQIERQLDVERESCACAIAIKSSLGRPGRGCALQARPVIESPPWPSGRTRRSTLIKSAPLFENCSKQELQSIARIADELDVREGKVLIREGERGREFFVIVTGEVEVRRKGRKMATLGPGSFVGEMALLSKIPRVATVTAVTPLDVLVITDRAFLDLLEKMPSLTVKVARTLAERVGRERAERPASRQLTRWARSSRACASSRRRRTLPR